MSEPPNDPPERKSVVMRQSMWQDIEQFRISERIETTAEALRRLVMMGLRSDASAAVREWLKPKDEG